MTSSRLIRLCAFLLVGALSMAHVLGVLRLGFVERIETLSYDLRLKLGAATGQDPRIVIIDIDERSLAEQGRWPWPRDRLARLVDELTLRQGVAVIGFDVVFSEPDTSSGLQVLRELAAGPLADIDAFSRQLDHLSPTLDFDQRFAAALARSPVILGYYFTTSATPTSSGLLPAPLFFASDFAGHDDRLMRATGFGANIESLQVASRGAGHFTPIFDADGQTRRVPLLIEYDGEYYEALALAVARHFLNAPLPQLGFPQASQAYGALEWLQLGERVIPVDLQAAALIPYRGRQGSFIYLSATDVLEGRLPEGELGGRIALVGTSAPGLMDLRSTPVGNAFPGVEIHANMIAGIIDGSIRHRPAWTLGYEAVCVAVLWALLSSFLFRAGPAPSLAAIALVTALTWWGTLQAWLNWHLVLPVATLLCMSLALYAVHTVISLFVEARAKKQIASLFGQYVPPAVVEELAANPALASMEGDSREMSVLFSDIRGFTSISEGMPPQELTRLINRYLSEMTESIQVHGGTVDKYIGDAIMAFWGAPIPSPDHARNAVLAALDMQRRAERLRHEFALHGWPQLHIGIGLSTGMMTVGNMGSVFRRAYTVMGDAVNLGSRLESLTKQYGALILASERTRESAGTGICWRELDRIRVKGKDVAVTIHEAVADATSTGNPEEAHDLFTAMLDAYRHTHWDAALDLLDRLEAAGERSALVTLYRARIAHFRENPPAADWDGVFAFDSK